MQVTPPLSLDAVRRTVNRYEYREQEIVRRDAVRVWRGRTAGTATPDPEAVAIVFPRAALAPLYVTRGFVRLRGCRARKMASRVARHDE